MSTPDAECKVCPKCKGAKVYHQNYYSSNGNFSGTYVLTCRACNGTGDFLEYARNRLSLSSLPRP